MNTILEELKPGPVDRLEDLYSVILTLQANTNGPNKASEKILSFAGTFDDMSEKDYSDFLQNYQEIRSDLFDRGVDL